MFAIVDSRHCEERGTVMSRWRYALFETPIGACGIVWEASRLIGIVLPERDPEATRGRLLRRYADAVEAPPPESIQALIDQVDGLLSGEPVDLSTVELDLSETPDFHRRVYGIARNIPPGGTRTYGDIARELGDVSLSRAVGQALGQNPWPIVVPCHRVLAASGRTGGFSAPGGVDTKLRILSIEARHASGPPGLFDDLPLAARPRPRG
jgi:methylated-DNA-[protein]-cysteine S-methyltransferase